MAGEYVAIHDKALIARGDLEAIVRQTKAIGGDIEPVVFELETCKRVDLDWHGDAQSVIDNLPGAGAPGTNKRGRPKLGVIPREVTLLPRHWDWLATQRGGASVTLRRLVDSAMKSASTEERISMQQNQLYGLMSVLADEPGFEEAARALYRNSKRGFESAIGTWPEDIQQLLVEKFDAIGALHREKNDD
ncbi:DUF2239 family protein [Microbulbifer harenosus]|uniref:DUF2239 family protein n=1 Tax=Microbulbifer harenosus TaxID=2576840 RepID=A0ABY2UGG9_9GAMM|nr:DUF2239 family protein [Microbulbifer harenosus]TLM75733.1 DUF2239 family protein [Microbulbifer harenosus]